MQLYWYQEKLKREIYSLLRQGKRRVLAVAMTGSGKSVVLSSIVKDAVERGRRCLILVTRAVLVEQLSRVLQRFDVEHGFIKAGKPYVSGLPCYVATLQTLARRQLEQPPGLVVVDEAHETAFYQEYERLLGMCPPETFVLGFTASPWRTAKNEGLSSKFEACVYAPTTAELIEMGFLVPGRYYTYPKRPELHGIPIVNQDYDITKLGIACNTDVLVNHLVEQFLKICPSRKGICFAVNVEHSQNIARAFNRAGIVCRHVDGSTPEHERNQIYRDLEESKIQMLTSCNVLTTGFDVKSIDCVILARPTLSRTLHFQQIGRAMRISPETGKKDFVCLDQAGNVLRFGTPEQLSAAQMQMDSPLPYKPGEAPVKVCPSCDALVPISQQTCPECGHEFLVVNQKLVITDDLKQLDHGPTDRERAAFVSYARRCFYANLNWSIAYARFFDEFKHWPTLSSTFGAIFKEPSPNNQQRFANYLIDWAKKRGKSAKSVIRALKDEFDVHLTDEVVEYVERSFSR